MGNRATALGLPIFSNSRVLPGFRYLGHRKASRRNQESHIADVPIVAGLVSCNLVRLVKGNRHFGVQRDRIKNQRNVSKQI